MLTGRPLVGLGARDRSSLPSDSEKMDALRLFLSSSTLQFLSVGIVEQLQQWLDSSGKLSVFISGRTGGGKSTLVNSLLGARVAEEGAEPDPSTAEVTCYERSLNNVLVKVWDSPGLQDGRGNEERYLADIAAKCGHVDLFLFCINVGDAKRFNSDSPEVKALVKLTRKLGKGIWDHALVALTFANRLGRSSDEFRSAQLRKDTEKLKELFQKKVCEWEEFIRRILLKDLQLSPDQVDKLKIVPTGSRRVPSLPDRRHWLSTFWFEALRSTHPRAQPALLKMNERRIIENPETVDEKTREKHGEDQTFIFSKFAGDVGKMMYGDGNLGSIVGLAIAEIRDLQLKESMLLEQFAIMKMIEAQQDSDTSREERVDQDVPESLTNTLSQLTVGSPPTSQSVAGLPVITGEPQDITHGAEEDSVGPVSPSGQCGGPFYDELQ